MTDREKELEQKLAKWELSLLRAWDALQKVCKIVEQYRGPSREHGKPKNFEAEGLARGKIKIDGHAGGLRCGYGHPWIPGH